jgi:two-component system heavy metal sensor histidine kinase CusS
MRAAAAQRPKDYRINGRLFSLAAARLDANSQTPTIQIAQDRSTDEQFTREFGLLLAVVLAVGVPAAALIAMRVTKRGLRPLAEMAHSLGRIGPAHLNERVAPAGWPRELQPLAASFDQMLDRLEDSFTRLSQFSADLAHELRTPVANIRGEAEVALTRARPAEEYREVIESIVGECQRLSGMIDKLLFLARSETGRGDIQPAVFEGRAEIEKIASFYETVAEEQHVAIDCSGEGEVYADPMLFGRALSNIVENALRFTPSGGTVSLSVLTRPGQTEISVKDSGAGIAPEDVPRVFDRFFRGDSSRSSHGTGLGLALVKSIADLHGGSATIESKLGRGTTVTLRFPRAEA